MAENDRDDDASIEDIGASGNARFAPGGASTG
jgi:hypothetical protein